jgi:hypothetical protein
MGKQVGNEKKMAKGNPQGEILKVYHQRYMLSAK